MDQYYITDVYGYLDIHHFRRKFDEVLNEINNITVTNYGDLRIRIFTEKGGIYIYLARDPSRGNHVLDFAKSNRDIYTERRESTIDEGLHDVVGIRQYTTPLPRNYWFTYEDPNWLGKVINGS